MIPVLAILVVLFLFQSSDRTDILMVGTAQEQKELKDLFRFLEETAPLDPSRFTIIEQITKILKHNADEGRVNLFLTTYVASNPNDPFGAYYLYQVAENYYQQGAMAFATQYFERILRNHPDLRVANESLHYLCLSRLTGLVEDPYARLDYLKDLSARFDGKVDSARLSYYLGRIYESIGEWDQAIKSYLVYLKTPQTIIPGDPKAHSRVRALVDLYNFDKRWIRQDLKSLMDSVRGAVHQGSISELENLRAKAGFFIRDRSYIDRSSDDSETFDVRAFLWDHLRVSRNSWGSSTIVFDREFSVDSNDSETFIRTTGWNHRIPTWYFYFRKVNYPPDPEIHGGWEWLGIYLGEGF